MNMKISEDTENVLQALDSYTDGNVRKRNDIGIILEACAAYAEHALAIDIVFYGTALWNVFNSLKKAQPDDEVYIKLESQLKEMAEELKSLLSQISGLAGDDTAGRFDGIYLQASQGAFLNLLDLAHDLAKFKSLQMRMKEKSKEKE